jgi:hypothetical protein
MSADIDIDFADRNKILNLIQHTPARQTVDGRARKHNSGVYVTAVPQDAVSGCAAIEYQEAEQRGYFKIDLLNVSVYELIQNEEHYQELLTRPPTWSRLWLEPAWAEQLIHIGRYNTLLASMRPDSIERMAAFISIIRPGKAHLQNLPWDQVFDSVWDGDSSRGFVFKKSHAIGYAKLVALHMNLLDNSN